jgi:predicted AAA+ superfamily ATPase
MVIRKRYIHILQSVKNTDFIKILTGMRRSGKSTILLQFIEILKKENPKGKFIYINFDDKLNNNLKDSKALENYIDNFIKKNAGKKIFLFLDEIQDVGGFDVLILGYFQNKNINIFLTGSNSKLLSSQLSSKFTGRDLQINVLPFSFAEFCEYYPEESDLTALFQRYRKVGGLPNFFSIKDENLLEHSANNLIETILIKDLLPFYKIKNVMLLKKILTFAYENIGCEFSSENIKTYLKNNPPYSNIAAKTIDSYLSYLCDAYLIYKVQRIDLKGMNILKTLYSCYATDLLLRNS